MSKMKWQTLLNQNRIGRRDGDVHDDGRSPFEVDFDRIVFSSAFRRLQDKTQVFPLSESDYVRTRLTHSLEVSCVGRSLGTMVGNRLCKKYGLPQHPSDIGAIVAAACLAHDLGNPPLGHSGEDAIRHWFDNSAVAKRIKVKIPQEQHPDIAAYEGNAQGFRLLTQIIHPDSDGGLQLTYATLAAMAKYPVQSGLPAKETKGKAGAKKFGFFHSEKASFTQVAEKTGLLRRSPTRLWWCRHPLAFLMEAADDICYRAVDFEDGYRLGLISYDEIHEVFCNILGETPTALAGIKAEKGKVQYLRARAIGTLVKQATKVFLDVEPRCLDGSFDKELLTLIPATPHLNKIKALTVDKIYSHPGVIEIEAAGFEVLGGLLDAFAAAAFAVAATQKRRANSPARSRKLRVIQAFEIERGSGSPQTDFAQLLERHYVPANRVDTVANYAAGWVKREVDKLLEQRRPAILAWSDFQREMTSFIRKVAERDILQSFAPNPSPADTARLLPRVFVQQLELIGLDFADRLDAVSEFFKASFDRTKWGESGEVHPSSLDDLDGRLMQTWKHKKRKAFIEASAKDDATKGQLLFSDCMLHADKLEGADTPSHFIPGCFHLLADELKVGWHPDYAAEMKRARRTESA